ncbi:MAG TPA: glycosyltransferase family A protein [Thermomicrobiales bacterium]|jgi:chlorobactene glucosyltransferase
MNALFWLEVVCCVIALIVTANTIGNLSAFRRLSDFAAEGAATPAVSVLVPARNEERSLGACLASLVRQEYGDYEIIVLDDGSDDGTAAIARSYAEQFSMVRIESGQALPPGWFGKAFACDQLALLARGDQLIFTDADTVHAPTMIRSVVGAVAAGADVVTAFPEQEIGGWSEALVVPFIFFTIWAMLPVGRVWSDPSPRVIAANGQLLAFTRAAYTQIGGHRAVRRSVLDDMDLARRAKRGGLRVRLTDGTGAVRTRMYRTAAEVWRGFSKNAYALTGASPGIAFGFALLLTLLYVLPSVVLVFGFVAGRNGVWTWRILPLILIGLMIVQNCIVARRMRRPFWQPVVHPLCVVCFLVILANSVRWHAWSGMVWKDRFYPTRESAAPDVIGEAEEAP